MLRRPICRRDGPTQWGCTTLRICLQSAQAPYAAAQTPQWQALPAETRHTLTKLMVRLIFGHADDDLAREREEMRHDV